jgi:hypothetical protein
VDRDDLTVRRALVDLGEQAQPDQDETASIATMNARVKRVKRPRLKSPAS